MSQTGTVSNTSRLIDKNVARESISKMKIEKAAGPACAVSETVKAAGEAVADMIRVCKSDYSRKNYSIKMET